MKIVQFIPRCVVPVVLALVSVAGAATYAKGPYLINPNSPTEMTVLLQATATAGTCTIEWGTPTAYSNGSLAMTVLNAGAFQYRSRLTSLTANTRYFYRVNLDNNQQTGTFRTPPPADATSLTFYAVGDTRSNPTSLNAVANAMLNDVDGDVAKRETLWIHSGDWSNDDQEITWTAEWFSRSGPRLLEAQRRLPVMGCEGNHEGSATALQKYYPYKTSMNIAANQSNLGYSFDYGPAHFAVLTSSSTSWLVADMQASTKPWKFLVFHEPAWGTGSHGNDTGYQTLVTSLNAQAGVHIDMCICGHNHNYVRAETTGTGGKTYHMTAGGGGASLHSVPAATNVVFAKSAYSFLRVDLNGNTLTGKAVGTDNVTFDTFSLTKPDVTAPSVPGNVVATAQSSSSIQITWNASTDNVGVTGYQVYRGAALVGSPATTSFTDTGLTDATPYSYTVKARDAAGNVSAASAPAGATTLSIDPDANHNGMPDAWEITWFGSTTNPLGAADYDWDHDGQINLHEYLAGTNPTDPADVFKITSVTRDAGGDLVLRWPSVSGKSYKIQTSTDLPGGFHDTADAPLPGTGGTLTKSLPIGPAATGFYRIAVIP
ncbi:MAG: metallophosphoesterase [Verrucomicrobia bacterium]|nr:metallophosphoesterase [Verrucomicrobiota bacterium]